MALCLSSYITYVHVQESHPFVLNYIFVLCQKKLEKLQNQGIFVSFSYRTAVFGIHQNFLMRTSRNNCKIEIHLCFKRPLNSFIICVHLWFMKARNFHRLIHFVNC